MTRTPQPFSHKRETYRVHFAEPTMDGADLWYAFDYTTDCRKYIRGEVMICVSENGKYYLSGHLHGSGRVLDAQWNDRQRYATVAMARRALGPWVHRQLVAIGATWQETAYSWEIDAETAETAETDTETDSSSGWTCPQCGYSKQATCKDGTRVCADCGYYQETDTETDTETVAQAMAVGAIVDDARHALLHGMVELIHCGLTSDHPAFRALQIARESIEVALPVIRTVTGDRP